MPKKDFVITLPCLGKFCLQRRTGISCIMKIKTRTVMSCLFSRLSAELVTFLHLKRNFHRSYILALFTNFSVVAAMLLTIAKLSDILRSECANTWEFLHSLGKELKVMMIPPLKNIFYSAITHLILKISQFLQLTTINLKSH